MPNGPKGGLDQRDFMALALGSVGATVAVSVNANAAIAQKKRYDARSNRYDRIVTRYLG